MRVVNGNSLRWDEEEVAIQRYPAEVAIVGREDWITLVEGVTADADPLEALEVFLRDTETKRKTVAQPRIFISHKFHTADNAYAERIARLATLESLDFWLDLYDPVLKHVNGRPFTGPHQAVLVAAIVEIALLNCTSVIAVHTHASAQSKWIPYEFGRVKLHIPVSTESAGWFHPNVRAGVPGEFFELAVKTYGEQSVPSTTPTGWNPWQFVTDWLKGRAKPAGGGATWSSPTSPLP